jgi:hypothetical protein
MRMSPGHRTLKIALAGLLGVSLTLPMPGMLDFAPEFVTTKVEGGFQNVEVALKDGASRVVYCPPVNWKAEPGERHLRFHPPGVSLADLTIEEDKAPPGRVLDAAAAERCRAWLKASIPGESTNAVVEPDESNPGAVASCPTFGTTVVYTSGGTRYRKRTIFVFAPDSEIRFTLVSRVADFDRLYPAVRRSLFSWRWENRK